MAVVKSTDSDIALLARLLRAEGEGEGQQGNADDRQCRD